MLQNSTTSLLAASLRVTLFSDVFEDVPGRLLLQLLNALEKGDEHATVLRHSQFFKAITELYPLSRGAEGEDLWQAHFAVKIAESNNAFMNCAELLDFDQIPSALAEQAVSDLTAIQQMRVFGPDRLVTAIGARIGSAPVSLAGLRIDAPSAAKSLLKETNWSNSARELARQIRIHGAGIFGRYRAFRWIAATQKLRGIDAPDSITLDQIWEYDWQIEKLTRNTQKLLAGYPANNALLYGDRGTGKSSTVKALINKFYKDGLRLVEVNKEDLVDFPEILNLLRSRSQKFILYIDDLSFEEDDSQFKALKAVLEGGVETRPLNVALYATSNRRNLVKERFSDRQRGPAITDDIQSDDIHTMDSYQEKLSLADRFGIRLPFMTPDKPAFLNIVRQLAARAQIQIPTSELEAEAMKWQGAMSGRSARQFIDWMIGEVGLTKNS